MNKREVLESASQTDRNSLCYQIADEALELLGRVSNLSGVYDSALLALQEDINAFLGKGTEAAA